MEELFYEIINEAQNGKVVVDDFEWPIAFNTYIEEDNLKLPADLDDDNDNNLSMLIIKNKSEFFSLLEEYVNKELEMDRKTMKLYGPNVLRDKTKLIISYLFVNATTEEFLNPCDLIRRRIKFLNDKTFSFFKGGTLLELGPLFKGSKLYLQDSSQSVMMETPRKFELSFVKGELEYKLPEISYGIANENGVPVCYIYSFLDKQKKEFDEKNEEKYFKEIKRLFYKVNANVIDDSEEENIKDVSPSSVISLIVFATVLRKYNISEIRGVPYLPLRYLSREIGADRAKEERQEELRERNSLIQYNVTNKFVRTFNRVAYHMEGFDVVSYPYEIDEYVRVINKGKELVIDNELLEDVSSSIRL